MTGAELAGGFVCSERVPNPICAREHIAKKERGKEVRRSKAERTATQRFRLLEQSIASGAPRLSQKLVDSIQ